MIDTRDGVAFKYRSSSYTCGINRVFSLNVFDRFRSPFILDSDRFRTGSCRFLRNLHCVFNRNTNVISHHENVIEIFIDVYSWPGLIQARDKISCEGRCSGLLVFIGTIKNNS